jgi:hypothetical protein
MPNSLVGNHGAFETGHHALAEVSEAFETGHHALAEVSACCFGAEVPQTLYKP